MWRLIFLILAGPVAAECVPPVFSGQPPVAPVIRAPEPPRLLRPELPFCASDYDRLGHHSCDSWEVSMHRDRIELYVQALRDYQAAAMAAAALAEDHADAARAYEEALEEYARGVETYVDCEVPGIRDENLKKRPDRP